MHRQDAQEAEPVEFGGPLLSRKAGSLHMLSSDPKHSLVPLHSSLGQRTVAVTTGASRAWDGQAVRRYIAETLLASECWLGLCHCLGSSEQLKTSTDKQLPNAAAWNPTSKNCSSQWTD